MATEDQRRQAEALANEAAEFTDNVKALGNYLQGRQFGPFMDAVAYVAAQVVTRIPEVTVESVTSEFKRQVRAWVKKLETARTARERAH